LKKPHTISLKNTKKKLSVKITGKTGDIKGRKAWNFNKNT
jgi:hypothetical protein